MDKKVFCAPAKKDVTLIRKLEKKNVFLPLSLRAWIEEVGDLNLAGAHPRLCFWEDSGFPGIHADPLMVVPHLFTFEIDDWLKETKAGEPLDALLGWDAKAKRGSSSKMISSITVTPSRSPTPSWMRCSMASCTRPPSSITYASPSAGVVSPVGRSTRSGRRRT